MKAKRKTFIALASFAVCSLMFLGVVVYPVFQGVLEDYGRILLHKKEILQLKEDAKGSREFETLSARYAKEFTQLESLFVDSKTPIAFFRFLDETAALFNLTIEKVPGLARHLEGDPWPSFEVRLAGGGSYPNVTAFLQKIENSLYLIEIKTLTISSKKSFQGPPAGGGEVDFSLSLKVFTE